MRLNTKPQWCFNKTSAEITCAIWFHEANNASNAFEIGIMHDVANIAYQQNKKAIATQCTMLRAMVTPLNQQIDKHFVEFNIDTTLSQPNETSALNECAFMIDAMHQQ